MNFQRPLLVLLAPLMALSALAGCSSDAATDPPASITEDPENSVETPGESDIATKIAIAGRPARADGDTFVIFYHVQDPEGVANVDLTVSDEDGTTNSSERLAVAAGESVEFEGWTLHVEDVFDDTLSYWFVRPDGSQVGGTPRN